MSNEYLLMGQFYENCSPEPRERQETTVPDDNFASIMEFRKTVDKTFCNTDRKRSSHQPLHESYFRALF